MKQEGVGEARRGGFEEGRELIEEGAGGEVTGHLQRSCRDESEDGGSLG